MYRMVQVFTGHECFGEYLCRIGKDRTIQCHRCASGRDTAQHTLEIYLAWAAERGALAGVIQEDLSMSTVRKMLDSEEAWMVVSFFFLSCPCLVFRSKRRVAVLCVKFGF